MLRWYPTRNVNLLGVKQENTGGVQVCYDKHRRPGCAVNVFVQKEA